MRSTSRTLPGRSRKRTRLRAPQAERRVVLCRRLLGIGPNPSRKDAELIAFRVGKYHPRRITLPDIGPPSTEGKQTFDFCGLIDRTEVSMEPVLACLLLCEEDSFRSYQSSLDGMGRPEASLAIGRGLPGRLSACPVEPQVAGGLSGKRAYVCRVGCARQVGDPACVGCGDW